MTSALLAAAVEAGIGATIEHSWAFIKARVEDLPVKVTPTRDRGPIRADSTLRDIIHSTAENVSRNLPGTKAPIAKAIKAALVSPEVETIARQVFAASLLLGGNSPTISQLRGWFGEVVTRNLPPDSGIDDERLGFLFDGLVGSCNRLLEVALTRGSLVALDARASLRHRFLLDEVAALNATLSQVASQSATSVETVLDFEKRYRKEIGIRHSTIVPPHLSEHDRVKLDELFVAPGLEIRRPRSDAVPDVEVVAEPEDIEEFLNSAYRAVILGTPGGGKSTLAAKLSHDLATRYSQRPYGGRQVTPVLVVVRNYGSDNKEKGLSIIQHLEATANSTYQLEPPPDAFDYLLAAGRLLVIFDGLDELLDTSFRRKVTQDIESFCRQFPAVPVIVTAREVGYEEAPLARDMFDEFRLAPFSAEQVSLYAEKWFALNKADTPEKRKEKAKAFLSESASAPDLRSNPLLLGLMCNIYREETYIPKNRPEIYRKCAEMLFDRWDRHRSIPVKLRYDLQLRPVLAHIAHWLYSSQTTTGVTERQLVSQAASYHAPKIGDPDQAESLARDFVEFARGRAWVFTDQGTTPAGDRLYQFTHRTFLEYFTALHLVRTHESTDDLMDSLIPRVAKQEWGIVPQLACHIKSLDSDVAGDRILVRALEAMEGRPVEERWQLVLFAAQCLTFIVPDAEITRRVASAAFACTAAMIVDRVPAVQDIKGTDVISRREIMPSLLGISDERRPLIARTLTGDAQIALDGSPVPVQKAAFEIASHLDAGVRHHQGRGQHDNEGALYWSAVSDEFTETNKAKLLDLGQGDTGLMQDAFWRGLVSPEELLQKGGPVGLFLSRPYVAYPGMSLLPPARLLVDALMQSREFPGFACRIDVEKMVAKLGTLLLRAPAPWVGEPAAQLGFARMLVRPAKLRADLPPQVLFGAFALSAGVAEVLAATRPSAVRSFRGFLISSGPLSLLLRSRFLEKIHRSFDRAIAEVEFSQEQEDFVRRWATKEFSLVDLANRNPRSNQTAPAPLGSARTRVAADAISYSGDRSFHTI